METTDIMVATEITEPVCSTDSIWRGIDTNRCLTDDLNTIEANIATLNTSKAATNHTHSGYAPTNHTHTEYADADHTHSDYAATNHTHTEYANTTHTHDYAATNHDHDDDYSAIGHNHSYNDLTDKPTIPSAYTHPANHPASMITGLADVATSGSYNDLSDKPAIPSAYTHPSTHPASMITGLADVATSGSYNDLSDKPTIPTVPSSLPANGGNADTVDGKHADDFATASHNHDNDYADISHTHAQSEITGLATALSSKANTSHTHAQSEVTGLSDALEGKANATHTHTGFAAETHNHNTAYIAKALQMVSDTGNVEYEMAGLDIIATIEGMPTGMHTGYCPVNSTNAPLSNEAWRFLVHKTGTTYGWVLAFGSYGSVYSNYYNAGTWRGWKKLIDGTSAPLWKHESDGGFYMTANQTVTPSKALNQCNNGWVLMWSDYDPSTSTTNNADICTTYIPKRNPLGDLWSGQGFLCVVPTYMNDTDDTDVIHIKKVYVHNDKLVGFAGNNLTDRRDVVLRAVYEY